MMVPIASMVQCPLDKAHTVSQGRLQYHITKCQQSFERRGYITCPFNSTHMYLKSEEENHKAICLDYIRIMNDFQNIFSPISTTSTNLKKVESTPTVDTDCEMWDDEIEAVTYDPSIVCERKRVLRMLQLVPTVDKKEFREQEKLRHEYLETMEKVNKTKEVPHSKKDTKSSTMDNKQPDVPTCSTSGTQTGAIKRLKNGETSCRSNETMETVSISKKQLPFSYAEVCKMNKFDGRKRKDAAQKMKYKN